MKLLIDKSFEKDLKKVKDKSLKLKIANTLESLLNINSLDELRRVKKVKGDDIYYRIKLGDYRLGFSLEEKTITVIRFLHRKDIYKYFPKKKNAA